jgi:hypothetical protein
VLCTRKISALNEKCTIAQLGCSLRKSPKFWVGDYSPKGIPEKGAAWSALRQCHSAVINLATIHYP